MTKIAIVTDSYHPQTDGVVTCVDMMEEMFNRDGYSAEIIAPDSGKGNEHRPGVHYCKSIGLSTYAGYYIPIYPSHTVRTLREMKADLVHAQGCTLMTLKGIRAARRVGIPVIVTFHTMVSDAIQYYSPFRIPKKLGQRLSWIYVRFLARKADVLLTPSEDSKQELLDHGVVGDVRAISLPIDVSMFKPADGRPIREKYGLVGKRVMVSVGRISYEKEIDRIIDALPQLDRDIVLLIVGKGPAEGDLRYQAESLGVSDRVIFTGFIPHKELPSYYCAGDIMITASRFETQCLTVLEAMACGVPIACANARALRDYMEDGVNGFLFGDDPKELPEAVNKCLEHGHSFSDAMVHTLERFSMSTFESKMKALYQEVIGQKRSENE